MIEIKEIVDYASKIADGSESVKPGTAVRFTEASTVNDRIWQGDLAITIKSVVPKSYRLISSNEFIKLNNNQMVHGSNQGSKHCIDSFDGVEMYIPNEWNEESLQGPFLILTKERTITHPKHGDVTIPANFCVQITYQREYDEEQKRERRARD